MSTSRTLVHAPRYLPAVHITNKQALKSGHLFVSVIRVFKELQLERIAIIKKYNYRVTPEGNSEFAGWARMAQVSMSYMASFSYDSSLTAHW